MFLINLIHFILDLAALALWINWRTYPQNTQRLAPPATLVGTLRRADPPMARRWHYLAGLGTLLIARVFLYRFIASAVFWTGILNAGVVSVVFRVEDLSQMFLYSLLSFGVVLWIFHLWMLLLSLVNPGVPEAAPFQHFARQHLGAANNWPVFLKLILPLVGSTLLWWLISWPLTHWGFLPTRFTATHRLEQALVIGIASYFVWKYLIAAVLLLHLVNSYVYFGNHGFWHYVNGVARLLLRPMAKIPVRVGKVDFAPVVALVLVLFLSHVAVDGLPLSKNYKIPGLVDLYARLPF